MSNETQHIPADVRERVKEAWATVEAAALAQANLLDSHYGGQPSRAAKIRNAVEQVAALLRTPRGEGAGVVAAASAYLRALDTYREECRDREIPLAEYAYDEFRRLAEPLVEAEERLRAALRSDAQGEDRWEDLVFGPITQAYNEALAARRGEGGGK